MCSPLVSAIMASQIRGGALTIAILLIASTYLTSAASNNGHIASVRVVGTVFCDTCFRQEFSKSSYFIKGAPVAVECETAKERAKFRIEANTNEHGQFEVEIPASVLHSETQLKRCSATLQEKEEGACRVASMANASSFTLKSKQGGIHTYSAGFFTYRPQIIPLSCSNEVVNPNSKSDEIEVSRRSEFESSKQIGLPPFLSPFLPSPPPPPPAFPLPQIPSLPPFPFPPLPFLTPPPLFNLPPIPPIGNLPNPFQPPPASLIPPIGNLPNPFQPPPASLIPPIGNLPNPFQPPPASLIPPIGNLPNQLQPPSDLPIPPIPNLPIPPIPFLPPLIPLPPIPFIPPAQHTLKAHSTQP